MSEGNLIDLIHDLFVQSIEALKAMRYEELFWLMHERQRAMDELLELNVRLSRDCLEKMSAETSFLFDDIQNRTSEVAHSLFVELGTAEARRSYVRGMSF